GGRFSQALLEQTRPGLIGIKTFGAGEGVAGDEDAKSSGGFLLGVLRAGKTEAVGSYMVIVALPAKTRLLRWYEVPAKKGAGLKRSALAPTQVDRFLRVPFLNG